MTVIKVLTEDGTLVRQYGINPVLSRLRGHSTPLQEAAQWAEEDGLRVLDVSEPEDEPAVMVAREEAIRASEPGGKDTGGGGA